MNHLDQIFKVLGTPTDESWPGWRQLPVPSQYNFTKYPGLKLSEVIPKDCKLSESGIDLLKQMLTLNPGKRITASKAL